MAIVNGVKASGSRGSLSNLRIPNLTPIAEAALIRGEE
jgi:hypothetical protein